MAETGDIFREFKNAKPAEKVFLIAGGIGVVAILLYLHNQSGSQAQSQTNQPPTTAGGGIQTVPGPNNSQIPLLPTGQSGGPGYTPIFDQLGNLIGYQPVPPPRPAPPPTPTPPPTPVPGRRPPPSKGRDRDRHKPRGAHQTSPVSGVPALTGQGGAHGISALPPSRLPPTPGGVVSSGGGGTRVVPSVRPQRANPTLQSSVITRTAARTQLRGH